MLGTSIDSTRALAGAYDELESDMDAILCSIAGGSADQIIADMRAGLTTIKKHETQLYRSLNTVQKAIDKKYPQSLKPAETELLAPKTSNADEILNRVLATHMLRHELGDVAHTFERELGANLGVVTLERQLERLSALSDDMSHGNFQSVLQWIDANRLFLKTNGSTLEFDVSMAQYMQIRFQRGPQAAVVYARKHLAPFGELHLTKIYAAMGLLAAPESAANHQQAYLKQAQDALEQDYYATLGLAAKDPLVTTLHAGLLSLQTFEKVAKLIRTGHGGWSSTDELPMEVDLPEALQFHSVFVCPVSKQPTTVPENPPKLLPCGHILSAESVEKLLHSREAKCPYCPERNIKRDIRQVQFM